MNNTEIHISTTAEHEATLKSVFISTIKKVYEALAIQHQVDVNLLLNENSIFVKWKICQLSGNEPILNELYADSKKFIHLLGIEFSNRLFNYLLFNNKMPYINCYLLLYNQVKIEIADEVFGELFSGEFKIQK